MSVWWILVVTLRNFQIPSGAFQLSYNFGAWNNITYDRNYIADPNVCWWYFTQECFYSFRMERNLVDPASSHMLIWKIKPCMSKYKSLKYIFYDKSADSSLYQWYSIWWFGHWITVATLVLIHTPIYLRIFRYVRYVIIRFLSARQAAFTHIDLWARKFVRISRNFPTRVPAHVETSAESHSNHCPISLMVVSRTTIAVTGDGELGFDSGEAAWETATTSKEGSRRVNYPLLDQWGSD